MVTLAEFNKQEARLQSLVSPPPVRRCPGQPQSCCISIQCHVRSHSAIQAQEGRVFLRTRCRCSPLPIPRRIPAPLLFPDSSSISAGERERCCQPRGRRAGERALDRGGENDLPPFSSPPCSFSYPPPHYHHTASPSASRNYTESPVRSVREYEVPHPSAVCA